MILELTLLALVLILAAVYARNFSIEEVGFGQQFLPSMKQLVDDYIKGATGVGVAPCEVCGYEGEDRRFNYVADLYLCGECRGP